LIDSAQCAIPSVRPRLSLDKVSGR